ncbi:MAG TPA: hypothetical protein VMV10_07475 [Pirellulales bacterium]|nr:hypothetical protein [Pirellulales bacterium]
MNMLLARIASPLVLLLALGGVSPAIRAQQATSQPSSAAAAAKRPLAIEDLYLFDSPDILVCQKNIEAGKNACPTE